MRPIDKGLEPPSLIKHRKSRHADFGNYPDKAQLRKALVFEQGGLCCYCMGRIPDKQGQMKIEHMLDEDREEILRICQNIGGKNCPVEAILNAFYASMVQQYC